MVTVDELIDQTVGVLDNWIRGHSCDWDAWGVSGPGAFFEQEVKDWTFREIVDVLDIAADMFEDKLFKPARCEHGYTDEMHYCEFGCEDVIELEERHDIKEYLRIYEYMAFDDFELEKMATRTINDWRIMLGVENLVEDAMKARDEIAYASDAQEQLYALLNACHVVHYNGRLLEDHHGGMESVFLLATDGLDAACGKENVRSFLDGDKSFVDTGGFCDGDLT